MVIQADLLSQEITILSAPLTVDDYSNQVPDWANATSRTAAAYVRPISSSLRPSGDEYVEPGRNVVEAAYQVHTNDLAVSALDRVVFDGLTYEVDGQPLVWKVDPEGETGHAKFLLRRVAG